MTKTVYVTVNGPGEISGLLVPVAAALHQRMEDVRVVVILLPCTFASGREGAVAAAVPGVSEVVPVRRLWSLLFFGLPYPGVALIHLGGDLMYAALLAWRGRLPAWAWQWANRTWDRFMRGYFVKTAADAVRMRRQGISDGRVTVVGDLLVDAVHATAVPRSFQEAPQAPYLAFLPGSRRVEVVGLAPFFLEVAERVREVMPDSRFALLLSPYVDFDTVRGDLGEPDPAIGGRSGTLSRTDEGWDLVSARGTRLGLVSTGSTREVAEADFVVSIPGTKTGEAGALARPLLVVTPYNKMEEIPWYGLLGLLDWVPRVGRALKRLIMRTMVGRYRGRFYSQPNILASRPVVPEIAGFLWPQLISEKILEVFNRPRQGEVSLRGVVHGPRGEYQCYGATDSDRRRIHEDLAALYAPHAGAADRLVERVAGCLYATVATPR